MRAYSIGFALLLLAFGTASALPLIQAPVDESQIVALPGNTRPEVASAVDRGSVAADYRLDHMQLQLRRSPAQERVVERFVDSLQDPYSANYHHWLSAEEFGTRFGTDPADLRVVEDWLKRHGFAIGSIPPGRMTIDFTGTAAQVAAAFHTDIHRISVGQEVHVANLTDPAIPAALASVVAGVVSLHDFRPQSMHRRARPNFTTTVGCPSTCYPIAPGDLQTIYNISTVYKSGITGKGQTIAVIEDSDLFALSDFTNFRQVFGLSALYPSGNRLLVTHPAPQTGTNNCFDPGVDTSDGADAESTLDAEWASAAAPGARIELAACRDTVTPGTFLAAQNLVNAPSPPPILSLSFGYCETVNGATSNAALSTLYQQAVAEGISVFVATGDNGPAGCAGGSAARTGIGIDGWAAIQYNVAVGGTDFSDTYSKSNSQYWNTTSNATWASAKSYVPEFTWNDTCASGAIALSHSHSQVGYGRNGFCNTSAGSTYLFLGGGEGGPSGCFSGSPATPDIVGGTCKGNSKPTWQQGAVGNPADGVRDTPDISMFAGDGIWNHYFLLCFTDPVDGGGPCGPNPADWPPGGGGTSFAAPIMAGVQALVNQKMRAKQGNPAPVLYKLAAAQFGGSGNASCNASLGASSGSSCVFHDVTSGDTAQPCIGKVDCYLPSGTYGVLSTSDKSFSVAYDAHKGWDFATGLGSVNVGNLVANWAKAAPARSDPADTP